MILQKTHKTQKEINLLFELLTVYCFGLYPAQQLCAQAC